MDQKNNHQCLPGVKCDVTNCYFNDDKMHCTAQQIKVGPQFANTSADTVCDTFKPE